MSRIGKVPVEIPDKVKLSLSDDRISAQGPNGKLERVLPLGDVSVDLRTDLVSVTPSHGGRRAREMHGLVRTLIQNMVTGVSEGFSKTLVVEGVGYRVEQVNDYLVFNVGYSHPIWYELPTGVTATVDRSTQIDLKGADKEAVGQAAATIRAFRPPEPYKGKGIRYADEVIRRKVGKAGAAG